MPKSEYFVDLMREQLEASKREHEAELNRRLFALNAPFQFGPLTWRERVTFKRRRALAYLSTLWRALRGDDPYDVEQW